MTTTGPVPVPGCCSSTCLQSELGLNSTFDVIIIIPFALMLTNLVLLEFLNAGNDVKKTRSGMQAVLSPTLGPS